MQKHTPNFDGRTVDKMLVYLYNTHLFYAT